MSLGIDSLLSAIPRVAFFFATIYLGAAGHLSAQITQTAYVKFGFSVDDYSTIAMLDTATQKFAGQTPVKGDPAAITVSPNGLQVYFTSSFDNFAGEFNTVSRRFSNTPVGTFPAGVTVTPDGLHAYVANEGGNTVSVIDTTTQSVINNIVVGYDPASIAFSPDGLTAYVTNIGDRTLAVVDVAEQAVVKTYNMLENPYGVVVTPDGRFVYVTIFTAGSVTVIDTVKQAVVNSIRVPGAGMAIAATPDGRYILVTNDTTDGTLSVIDTMRQAVVNTIPVGKFPSGVAVTADSRFAYVTNSDVFTIYGTVTVIDLTRQMVVNKIILGRGPGAVGNFIGPNLITGTLGISSEAAFSELGFGQFVDLRGGTLQPKTQLNSARSLVFLTPGDTIEINNGSDSVFSGPAIGPGALNKTGAGMLTLLGTNTYAGGTNINGGTLVVTTGVGNGPLSFHNGTLEALSSGGGLALTNAITLNGGGGTFLADAGTTSTLSGVINGQGPLIKEGPGTLLLTGTNTYTGGTDINSGTVIVNNYSNLGKGPIRLHGGTLKVLNPK